MSDIVSISLRCSSNMLRGIDEIAASQEGVSRQDVIQHMVQLFVLNPTHIDAACAVELREPLSEFVVVSTTSAVEQRLRQMAQEKGVSVSHLLRNAILCGIRTHSGDLSSKEEVHNRLSGHAEYGREKCEQLVGSLIQMRSEACLSQRDVSDMSGVSQGNLAMIEQKKAVPRLDRYLALLSAFGYTVQVVRKGDK